MHANGHNDNDRAHYTLLVREEEEKVRVYVEPCNVLLYEADTMEEAFSRMDKDTYDQAETVARRHAH